MTTLKNKEIRDAISQAVSKRPQTKFAQLFREFESKPSQENIVLLLEELAQQKDFYIDFNISLQYFLDLYQKLDATAKESLFNEAALLIENATKIYGRRVDCLQQRVEDQLASLSSQEIKEKKNKSEDETEKSIDEKSIIEKPKKTRKRLIEATTDPFEIELSVRKFKKLSESKSMAIGSQLDRSKLNLKHLHVENYLHPALWRHAEFVDLDNEEDIDSKRNYRLYTSHLEHRYNTLVPDINFRLYFKMKDYLDEEDEREEDNFTEAFPKLSQAFVKHYIRLEDQALAIEQQPETKRQKRSPIKELTALNFENRKSPNLFEAQHSIATICDSGIGLSQSLSLTEDIGDIPHDNNNDIEINGKNLETTITENNSKEQQQTTIISDSTNPVLENDTQKETRNLEDSVVDNRKDEKSQSLSTSLEDSGNLSASIENSFEQSSEKGNSTTNNTDASLEKTQNSELNSTQINETEKSVTEESFIDNSTAINSTQIEELSNNKDKSQEPLKESTVSDISKETLEVVVHIETGVSKNNDYCEQLSPQNDEGICFSDIDDSPLSPITIQIEKSSILEDKQKIEINLNNPEQFILNEKPPTEFWPVKLNIFQFPKEVLKKMRRKHLLTDLGEEMEIFLRARHFKRSRTAAAETTTKRQFKSTYFERSPSSASQMYNSPPPSPCDSVFLGFSDEGTPVTRPITSEDDFQIETPRLNCKILGHPHRLSRDSGVGNDLLTATPEKGTIFFPPTIDEEIQENVNEQSTTTSKVDENNVRKNLFGNENSNQIEILENMLLQTPQNAIESSNNKETADENLNQVKDKEKANENENCDVDKSENQNDKEKSIENSEANKQEAQKSDEQMQLEITETADCLTKNPPTQVDTFKSITNINFGEALDSFNLNNVEKHIELDGDVVSKIQSWHRYLQPILSHSRERHHFDVFQIGTNIINEFSINSNNVCNKSNYDGTITFQDVMQQQDRSYVSRYFLSALLLINQGNLEMKVKNKSKNEPTKWFDIHLKLLSTERHVVSVEDNIGMFPTKKNSKDILPPTTPSKEDTKIISKINITTPRTPIKAINTATRISPQLLPPQAPAPSRKRSINNTAITTYNVNLNKIEIIKPIGKKPRMSQSEDSGFSSLGEIVDIS